MPGPNRDNSDSKSRPKKILVADDQESGRDLLRYILTASGFEVIEAADGQEVLEKVVHVKPDLFILDLNMPRCDGFAAAKGLRTLAAFEKTPIIALSAVVAPINPFQLTDAGFNLFLTKPVLPSKLRECIRQLVDKG